MAILELFGFYMSAIATFIFLFSNLPLESTSAALPVFEAIVQRAVADQTSPGLPLSGTNDPEDYAQATDRLEQEWETLADPETPDCSLALDMGALDPTGDKGALYRVIDWRQPRVAVFFRGPLPDVAPYFLPENRDTLLGSRPEDVRTLPVDALENRSWVDGDQRQRLQVATHQWKTGIDWHGEECPTYSYMLFEGQGR